MSFVQQASFFIISAFDFAPVRRIKWHNVKTQTSIFRSIDVFFNSISLELKSATNLLHSSNTFRTFFLHTCSISCWGNSTNLLGSSDGKKMGTCLVRCGSWRNNCLYFVWVTTRIPDNFITGRDGRISDNGILTEVFQFAFVVIVIAILALLCKKETLQT